MRYWLPIFAMALWLTYVRVNVGQEAAKVCALTALFVLAAWMAEEWWNKRTARLKGE